MFDKPKLAKCIDRNNLARVHPRFGDIETWFTESLLKERGIKGVSFDFFVNWSENPPSIEPDLWRKQLPSMSLFPDWQTVEASRLLEALRSDQAFVELARFGRAQRRPVVAVLFEGEANDWPQEHNIIRTVTLNTGMEPNIKYLKILDLQNRIRDLSGGDVRLGQKGLIYGTTTLECYLSRTNSIWPGDADLLLTDSDYRPIALIEFKKHTLAGQPINSQKLSNYYPNPDGRKYDRLALLCKNVGENKSIPFFTLYYPTQYDQAFVKIEKIEGEAFKLYSGVSVVIEIKAHEFRDTIGDILDCIIKHAQ